MRQEKTISGGDRTQAGRITSVTIGDGIGGGAGTVIAKDDHSVLEIWREGDVQRVPLLTAATATEMLDMLHAMSRIFNASNFTYRAGYSSRIDVLIAKAEGTNL